MVHVLCNRTQWKEYQFWILIKLLMVCFANTCSSIGTKLTSKHPPGPLLKNWPFWSEATTRMWTKSCNFFLEQWRTFEKGETFWSWNVEWQLEEFESVVYGKICSGVTPAVVASVHKLLLLKNSRKDNAFSKENCGLSQLSPTLLLR